MAHPKFWQAVSAFGAVLEWQPVGRETYLPSNTSRVNYENGFELLLHPDLGERARSPSFCRAISDPG